MTNIEKKFIVQANSKISDIYSKLNSVQKQTIELFDANKDGYLNKKESRAFNYTIFSDQGNSIDCYVTLTNGKKQKVSVPKKDIKRTTLTLEFKETCLGTVNGKHTDLCEEQLTRHTTRYTKVPRISKDWSGDTKITYLNSAGRSVTYEPPGEYQQNIATLLFKTVCKYFTEDDPNISPKEQVQLRADIAKNSKPMMGDVPGGRYCYNRIDVYEGIDFLLKTFSDEASEGGKEITPNEVYQMFECFHKWTDSSDY